jgi:hypothetical protein
MDWTGGWGCGGRVAGCGVDAGDAAVRTSTGWAGCDEVQMDVVEWCTDGVWVCLRQRRVCDVRWWTGRRKGESRWAGEGYGSQSV